MRGYASCRLKVMREGRVRAVRSRPGFVPRFLAWLVCLVTSASGCATEVNTSVDSGFEEEGGAAGSSAGGSKAPTGGKPPMGGSNTSGRGSGGAVMNAFGGTAHAGGGATHGGASGAGGTTAAAGSAQGSSAQGGSAQGGSAQGGSAQGGGASGASASGGAAGKGGAGQGSGGSSAGTTGTAGSGSVACLAGWKGSACDTCSTQTQSDRLACVKILDCYAASSCSPSTCSGNDDKCGANKIGQGTAGYPIAKQVYDCACP